VAGRVEKSWITGPIVFIFFGFLIGPLGLGWLSLDVKAGTLRFLAELTLALVLFIDAADVVASSGLDVYVDGVLAGDKIASINASGMAVWGYLSIVNSYMQVVGNEGAAGTFYLYADQGDENADKWAINANIDGSFSIENFTTGSWVDFLEISANKNILMYGGLQVFRDIDATAAWMSVGYNRTGNESARLDLIGDTTYTEYGLRIIRESGGANATSQIIHRGTGAFSIITDEAADIVFETNSISALRIASSGVLDVANSACVLDEDTLGTNSDTQLATQQSIKVYVDNKSYLDLGSILTGDGAYVGTKMTVTVDDTATVFGDVLAQAADFNYDRADASAAATSVGLVMALSGGSGSKEVLIEGQVCETDWTWSAGLIYLSITTGKMSQTAPVASGEQVVAVGWALSADTIYFKPSLVLAEVA